MIDLGIHQQHRSDRRIAWRACRLQRGRLAQLLQDVGRSVDHDRLCSVAGQGNR
ncbi:hypothetical protein ACTMU2_21385 [Cupriavidus basilensis]